jgi:alginate O-acetyltransferase complex protein AlgI
MAMLGLSGFELPAGIVARIGTAGTWLSAMGVVPVHGGGAVFMTNYIWVILCGTLALALPNVAQIFHRCEPVLYESANSFRGHRESGLLSWNYSNRWAIAVSIAWVAGVMTLLQVSEFLYFQF